MNAHTKYSSSDLYWQDKVQGPNVTSAAAFITFLVLGISMATAGARILGIFV